MRASTGGCLHGLESRHDAPVEHGETDAEGGHRLSAPIDEGSTRSASRNSGAALLGLLARDWVGSWAGGLVGAELGR